jgi:hypothetical protein
LLSDDVKSSAATAVSQEKVCSLWHSRVNKHVSIRSNEHPIQPLNADHTLPHNCPTKPPPHLAHALKLGPLAGADAVPHLGRTKVQVVDAEQVSVLLHGGEGDGEERGAKRTG